MVRAFLESATRSWQFRRALRVGNARVPLIVSPSGGLRYLFRPISRVDPLLVQLAQQYVHAGNVVWDLGANLGLFTFAAASLAGRTGRVFAIEADAWLVQLLRKSALMQPSEAAPVDVIPAAIARDVGIRAFALAKRSRSTNHLAEYGMSDAGGVRERQSVVSVSLDWLATQLPPPNVIKIDIEGAEVEALSGATQVLARFRPVLLCEVSYASQDAVTQILASNRYRFIDAETGQPTPRTEWSTVALPQEA